MRSRLLHELGRFKKARAADLAEALGEPANSVSCHLRQLARYGLIEPADDPTGDRRAKWWRLAATNPKLRLDDENDSPSSRRAMLGVVEVMRITNHELVDDFIDATSTIDDSSATPYDDEVDPTNWDLSFDLTRDEWKQFKSDLFDVRRPVARTPPTDRPPRRAGRREPS